MLARVTRALALSLAALAVAACGGESSERPEAGSPSEAAPATGTAATTEDAPPPATKKQRRKPARAAPLPGLPRFAAGYRSWTKLNSKPLPPRESDPHLGTKNVYVSTEAARGEYPVGTVVVKEGFRPGKDFIGLIATMRKIEGADPEHNDWVFVEWAREAGGEAFTELASGAVCSSCHVGAADQDYVFTPRSTGGGR
jgi:hypothetical protein